MGMKKLIAVAIKGQKLPCHRIATKGHFVVYSTDRKRFVVPLPYLKSNIFRELLQLSEEVFGLPKDGPITLPCDGASMDCVLSVVERNRSQEVEKALFACILSSVTRVYIKG